MTPEQVERLKALCDEFGNGALRGEDLAELVRLARMAVGDLRFMRSYLDLK